MADISAWDDAIAQAKWLGSDRAVEYLQMTRGNGQEAPSKIYLLENDTIMTEWRLKASLMTVNLCEDSTDITWISGNDFKVTAEVAYPFPYQPRGDEEY